MNEVENLLQNYAAPLQCIDKKPTRKQLLFRWWASPLSVFRLTVLHLQVFFIINYLEKKKFSQQGTVWTMKRREGMELKPSEIWVFFKETAN